MAFDLDLNKLWKDLSDSAREVAGQGLALGSAALATAAEKLRAVEANLRSDVAAGPKPTDEKAASTVDEKSDSDGNN